MNKIKIEQAVKDIKKIVKKGNTIYTVLRHVSKSGMFRRISCYVIKGNKPLYLDYYISDILSSVKLTDKQGLGVSGCGMDMGFSIVYDLSWALFCPNKYSKKAAYSLKQEWI